MNSPLDHREATSRVAVLLGTFNGAKFLPEQLHSFAEQEHSNWQLHASDDGSSDTTLAILRNFAAEHAGRVTVRRGPQCGFTQNFLSLATDAKIDADYFAFSDQDDIWSPDHLSRAIGVLAQLPAGIPAVHCGRTRLITETGDPLGLSLRFSRKPSFRNAIMQSIAGGNTMVFNRAARDLLLSAHGVEPVAHDWWVYQLVTGAGGEVHYDRDPTVSYRQHGTNQLGSNIGWRPSARRLRMLLAGRFSRWTSQNLKALQSVGHLLTPENRELLERVTAMQQGSLATRVASYRRSGIYRQTLAGTLALGLAVILKRV
jgi:glycosyltransferase involved in cell wall biosynthesis